MLHSVLVDVFQALEQSAIRWCILRVPEQPDAPRGDIDLLIDPDDGKHARQVIEACDFVRLPWSGARGEQMFLKFDQPTDHWFWLHVVGELAFGPNCALRTNAAHECLSRRRHEGALVRLAPDDEFWMLLLHLLLDKGSIEIRHRKPLQEATATACLDGPLARSVAAVCPPGWTLNTLLDRIREGDWEALERAGAHWAAQSASKGRLRGLAAIARRLPLAAWNRLRRRGLSVALLGPDGAGKSTLAAGLKDHFFTPVRSIYMGFGTSSGRSQEPWIARWRLPGIGSPGRLFWLWWRYLTALHHMARGRLVVFDRYTHDVMLPADFLMSTRRPVSWLRRLSLRAHASACPAPDLVIMLDAPGSLMFDRKGERSGTVLEAERQHYHDLRRRIPTIQVVDATREVATIRADVVDRIWKLYAARWKGHGADERPKFAP